MAKREVRDGYFRDLPEDLQIALLNAHKRIEEEASEILKEDEFRPLQRSSWAQDMLMELYTPMDNEGPVGQTRVGREGESYEAMIQFTGHFTNLQNEDDEQLMHTFIGKLHQKLKKPLQSAYNLRLEREDEDIREGFDVYPSSEVSKEIWELFDKYTTKSTTESVSMIHGDTIMEGTKVPEFKADQKEAVKAMRALSDQVMKSNETDKWISRHTTDTYAVMITKNFLSTWAHGYQKFSITLDDPQSFNEVSFRIPKMTPDFIERFIEGRETITGFLHRNPEIKLKISPRIFKSMKSPNDPMKFFKAAIQYYDQKVDQYATRLMAEVRKLSPEMRHLIKTTKLSGIVTIPLQLCFEFDDVSISDPSCFVVTKKDITAVSSFVKQIAVNYADPNKEKSAILKDLQDTVKALHQIGNLHESAPDILEFPQAVSDWMEGKFQTQEKAGRGLFESEQIDRTWGTASSSHANYFQEAYGVKKLKKIPADLVAYITIEAESIKDANDKMMIASYCLGKIEIVEWYIELIDTGSKKYIVPHNRPYLVSVKNQLLACYKKIMDTPIPKKKAIIDIEYPKGFEG